MLTSDIFHQGTTIVWAVKDVKAPNNYLELTTQSGTYVTISTRISRFHPMIFSELIHEDF